MTRQLNPAWSVDSSAHAAGSSGVQQVAMKIERTLSGHQIGMKYERTFSGRETWLYVSDRAPLPSLCSAGIDSTANFSNELNRMAQEFSPPAGTVLALGDYD